MAQRQQPCSTTPAANRTTGDKISDAIVGFGDAFLIPIVVRNLLDMNGTVDFNSDAYST